MRYVSVWLPTKQRKSINNYYKVENVAAAACCGTRLTVWLLSTLTVLTFRSGAAYRY